MIRQFEPERYDLVEAEKVRVSNQRFGNDMTGELDVWIEISNKGERFLSQLHAKGEAYAVRKEVYTTKCYILREKATGSYRFLDKNDCGFWMQLHTFSGAETFFGDDSVKVQSWLDGFAKRP